MLYKDSNCLTANLREISLRTPSCFGTAGAGTTGIAGAKSPNNAGRWGSEP